MTLKFVEIDQMTADQKLESFLEALNAISHAYGLGIGGGIDNDGLNVEPVVFILQPDDCDRVYRVDDDSELTFK